jgi:hypothetical protein
MGIASGYFARLDWILTPGPAPYVTLL